MTNLFALLCQSFSSRFTHRDAAATLRPPHLLSKQVSTFARLSAPASELSQKEFTIGWLAGLAAILAGCSSNPASESPTAIPTLSSVSPKEIQNYAKAVLAIEPSRQAAYSDIQKLTDSEPVPDITCTKADTFVGLSKNIQDIAVNYCNQSKKIGESQDLTMSQFNAITVTAQSNPELRKRIQNEMVRLQR